MNAITRYLRRVDPIIVALILVIVVSLRLLGVLVGPPKGLNYNFVGDGSILEYGEDGVAWLWLRGTDLSGDLSLPEGKWTASVVLPPCSVGSQAQVSLQLADLALARTIDSGQRMLTEPITFGPESVPIKVTTSHEVCSMVGDGRSVSVGVFLEPVGGVQLVPEIGSPVTAESSMDGRSWIWSSEAFLTGAIRVGPRAGGWAFDVKVPQCEATDGLSGSDLEVIIDGRSSFHTIDDTETITVVFRPTVTQSVPFTVTAIDSLACPIPESGSEAYFYVEVRPLTLEPVQ